jgi:hypothetical protein
MAEGVLRLSLVERGRCLPSGNRPLVSLWRIVGWWMEGRSSSASRKAILFNDKKNVPGGTNSTTTDWGLFLGHDPIDRTSKPAWSYKLWVLIFSLE